jgi:Domain of unknown function (DUF1844)
MSSSEQKSSGFKVTDRRSFVEAASPPAETATPSGTPPPEAPPPPAEAPPVPEAASPPATDSAATARASATRLPPVDFTTFVLSLGSSVLMHLGEVDSPPGTRPKRDLALAKHTIDLLSMLEAKTKGNLTAHEEKLLESLLFDLRLRYVSAAKPGG